MMNKKITIQEAEDLLEKYYNGFTSVEEEKLLNAFLKQEHLPEQFEASRAMFGYFASNKKRNTFQIIPLLRWTGIAAAVIIGIVIAGFWTFGEADSYAYIDGKKVKNIELVKEQALSSIQSWNDSDLDSNSDTDEIIIQQLQLFLQ